MSYLSLGMKSNFGCENSTYHRNIFEKMRHPNSRNHELSFLDQRQIEDSRFYLNVKSPAGLIFKVQLVDGGRIMDDSFPPLRNLCRLSLHYSLDSDCLKNIFKSLCDQSKSDFLKHIFYPEMNNQMGGIIKKWKLSLQVKLAEQEVKSRFLQNSKFFFEDFSNQELEEWLLEAKKILTSQNTYLNRSKIDVKCANPTLGIQMPQKNHFKYTFLPEPQNNLNQAVENTVNAVTHGSRFSWMSPLRLPIRGHPLNLSIFAQLAQGLPLKTFLDKDDRIHSSDDLRHDQIDNRELNNLMLFLSFGTWKPKHVRDTCIINDSSVQTVDIMP